MNSDYTILTTSSFNKSARRLIKKYSSLQKDFIKLRTLLLLNPTTGIALGKNCYKVRLKISSKAKGKSGGARIITYVKIQEKKITLLDIFDKSEKESISETELIQLLNKVV